MREYAIVCAVVRRGDAVLMVRQAGPGEEPAWTIPGGRVEKGEELVAALVREVAEETGLVVLDPGQVAFTTEAEDPSAGWSASVSTWDVAAWSGDLEPHDPDGYVLEAAWKPLGEALDLLVEVSWHVLTVRYLRGELDTGSRWRGQVGKTWSRIDP